MTVPYYMMHDWIGKPKYGNNIKINEFCSVSYNYNRISFSRIENLQLSALNVVEKSNDFEPLLKQPGENGIFVSLSALF